MTKRDRTDTVFFFVPREGRKNPSVKRTILGLLFLLALAVGGAAALFAGQYLKSSLTPGARGEVTPVSASEPALQLFRAREEYAPIVERNLFDAAVSEDGSAASERMITESRPEIALPPLTVQLLGTAASATPYAMAVIKNMDQGKVETYRVGETLSGAVIVAIRRARIFLSYGSEYQAVSIGSTITLGSTQPAEEQAPSAAGSAVEDGGVQERRVSRSNLLARVGGRTDEILGNTRFDLYLVGGEVKGIQIRGIAGESVIREMGVHEGDIITRANGYPINSYQSAIEVWERLKYANEVTLELIRNGEPIVLRYSLTR